MMMLLEPSQTKLAMMAAPRCGFVGLNPFRIAVPDAFSVPLR
jgi:hypothetical protein